ncbi:S-adenosylmethionine synthase [compost metagenome]
MVTAITETGKNLNSWVRAHFRDLSPSWIIDYLELWKRSAAGWSYYETAAYGHFGRSIFPWEKVRDL